VSEPENTLAFHLDAVGIPYTREVMFAKPRKWRADFSIAPDLLVEVEGGVWAMGRHQRPAGFEQDCRKYAAAVLLGYRVLRFTPAMIDSGEALQTIEKALAVPVVGKHTGGPIDPPL
jgi:hypothetical protein